MNTRTHSDIKRNQLNRRKELAENTLQRTHTHTHRVSVSVEAASALRSSKR